MDITVGNIIIYIAIFIVLYVITLWLVIFWENKNNIYKPKLKKNYPFVCIIVPCFNEEKTIVKTVRSLLNLDYPKDKLEIIIIDDGSTDKTYQKVEKLLKHKQVHPPIFSPPTTTSRPMKSSKDGRIKLFRKENGGKWTALNYGIERTNAEFIGCLDADSFVSPNALKLIMAYFADKKIMAVTPSIKVYQPQNIIQRIQRIEYIFSIIYRKIITWLNSLTVVPGPFSIYRKTVFEELGLFNYGHNTEDNEMAFRLQSKNWTIANAPNAYVYTVAPASLGKLQKQRERWYRGFIGNSWDYRYLFMNKKYEDLGFFILPMICLSLLMFIIVMLYTLFFFVQGLIDRFTTWQAIGFDFGQITFNLNWFFVDISIPIFVGFFILVLTIVMFLLGKKISNERSGLKKDFLLYLFLYSPLYLIWWLSTISKVLLRKKIKWQ